MKVLFDKLLTLKSKTSYHHDIGYRISPPHGDFLSIVEILVKLFI